MRVFISELNNFSSTHCGLVTPYGKKDPSQHPGNGSLPDDTWPNKREVESTYQYSESYLYR